MKVIFLPLVIFMFLVVLITSTFAVINHNTYIVGGEYVVHEGEFIDGNLVVLFAQVKLEKNTHIQGSIRSLSSTVDIRGTVKGNILSLESEVLVRNSAQINVIPDDTGVFPFVILLPEMARWNLSSGR
jgi:hypothetical protein